MENLNNCQLMELTEEEMIEIDGGIPAVAYFIAGVVVGACLKACSK